MLLHKVALIDVINVYGHYTIKCMSKNCLKLSFVNTLDHEPLKTGSRRGYRNSQL